MERGVLSWGWRFMLDFMVWVGIGMDGIDAYGIGVMKGALCGWV